MNLDYIECICPPGQGVYTVHTAQDLKANLLQQLYQSSDIEEATKKWKESIQNPKNQHFLLGIPSDNGGGILRGANWGPLFIREEFYNNGQRHTITDLGDIRVIPHFLHDDYLSENIKKSSRHFLYNNSNSTLPVSPLSMTEYVLDNLYQQYPLAKLIFMGGDHSISYATVKKWAQHKKQQNKKFGLIHFDAHTDLLESRMGVDLCFGSWTSHIIKYFNQPENIIQLGIRSSGKNKNHWEHKFGIKQYWANEINSNPDGMIEEIIKKLEESKIEEIYISFDIDALDSYYASSTGTPEDLGLNPSLALNYIERLSQHFKITALDIMEVAPFTNLHLAHPHNPQPQTTLSIASDIMKIVSAHYV